MGTPEFFRTLFRYFVTSRPITFTRGANFFSKGSDQKSRVSVAAT